MPSRRSEYGKPPTRPLRDAVRSAEAIAADLPEEAWQPILLGEGAKGPQVAQFARLRVWSVRGTRPGPPAWMIFRRELDQPKVKHYVSNAAEDVSLETLALVIATRWRVEEFFQDAKEYLGMADCEARGWSSWHHHMSLVGIAHLYVTLVREDLREEAPELSLDAAYRLICDALGRPKLTPEDSLRLTKYHLHYNHQAHQSHRKSWLHKHQRLAQELRL